MYEGLHLATSYKDEDDIGDAERCGECKRWRFLALGAGAGARGAGGAEGCGEGERLRLLAPGCAEGERLYANAPCQTPFLS